jgi:hypothetical protein
LRDEVYEQLSLLEKTQKLGEKIISTCEDEKSVKDEVNEKVGNLDRNLIDLTKKVNDRQKELKQALLERQEFREAFDDMKDWLVSTSEILAMQGPISVKYDVLVDQKAKHRVRFSFLFLLKIQQNFHSLRFNVSMKGLAQNFDIVIC